MFFSQQVFSKLREQVSCYREIDFFPKKTFLTGKRTVKISKLLYQGILLTLLLLFGLEVAWLPLYP